MDHALKNLQNLCSLKTAATFFLTVDCASNLMSDTKYPKETNSILSSFVQKFSSNKLKSVNFIAIHDQSLHTKNTCSNRSTQSTKPWHRRLKDRFLNFDNGILAKFFFEKFENWNFNSENSNLALRRWEPQDNAYLIFWSNKNCHCCLSCFMYILQVCWLLSLFDFI